MGFVSRNSFVFFLCIAIVIMVARYLVRYLFIISFQTRLMEAGKIADAKKKKEKGKKLRQAADKEKQDELQ